MFVMEPTVNNYPLTVGKGDENLPLFHIEKNSPDSVPYSFSSKTRDSVMIRTLYR
jgi:hypothetical protein